MHVLNSCSEEKVEVFAGPGLSRKREENHLDQLLNAIRTAEGCRGSKVKAAPHPPCLRLVSNESGVLGVNISARVCLRCCGTH